MTDPPESEIGKYRIDVRGARGVQIGDHNVQISYTYADRLTWTDGVIKPPLVDSVGAIESPYRGLGAFGEQDAPFFHGRESAIQQVLKRLSIAAQGSGLLVVSGVSGAGKSSLIRAGVLPRIRGQGLESAPGAARWTGIVLTPTRDPLEQLALQAARVLGTDAVQVRQNIAGDPSIFALTARQIALQHGPSAGGEQVGDRGRLLLIVDQLEQIFTQCTDDGLRRKFITAICSAASGNGTDENAAALVALVIRADFEARCADFPQLAAAIQDRYLVTSMDEVQLRVAIETPAVRAGGAVDGSLVDLLVREMLERPAAAATPRSGAGALPLLSHALDQAWRNRNRMESSLTLADYERSGRIQGAVAASAQRAFGTLTPLQQAVARQVFLRLATTSDDGTPVRDRVPREELIGVAGPAVHDDVASVVAAFTAERLVTQAADNVEISHDALLTAWPLLRDEWLTENRADLALRSRLRNAAREWAAHGKDPAYLYRGGLLEDASAAVLRITAAPSPHPVLNPEEDEFLRASDQARRRSAGRRRSVTATLVALTLALAVAAATAFAALAASNRALAAANAQELSAASGTLREINPAVSALAAAAAWQASPSNQMRDVMVRAATNSLTGVFDAAAGVISVSPDDSVLAIGNYNEQQGGNGNRASVTLWSMTERRVLKVFNFDSSTTIYNLAFSPVVRNHIETLAVSTSAGVIVNIHPMYSG